MGPDRQHDPLISLISIPRKFWYATTLVALVSLVWLSEPLWRFQLEPGTNYYGGPGDGLYFMFFLFLPWLVIMFLNVAFLIRDILLKRKATILFTQSAAVLIWAGLAWLLLFLTQAPEGVKYLGS
jgi:hypothetical protein